MSLGTPIDVLQEYEELRSQVIQKYYVRIDEIMQEFNALIAVTQSEIESQKEELEERRRYAQKLAEVASRFYESAQKMMKGKRYN